MLLDAWTSPLSYLPTSLKLCWITIIENRQWFFIYFFVYVFFVWRGEREKGRRIIPAESNFDRTLPSRSPLFYLSSSAFSALKTLEKEDKKLYFISIFVLIQRKMLKNSWVCLEINVKKKQKNLKVSTKMLGYFFPKKKIKNNTRKCSIYLQKVARYIYKFERIPLTSRRKIMEVCFMELYRLIY